MVVVLLILADVEKVIFSPSKEKVKYSYEPRGPFEQAGTYFQFL